MFAKGLREVVKIETFLSAKYQEFTEWHDRRCYNDTRYIEEEEKQLSLLINNKKWNI